jgi:hypothetical protein
MASESKRNLANLARLISDQQARLVLVTEDLEKLITPVVLGEKLNQQQKTELADLQQYLGDLLAEQQTAIEELNDHAARISMLAASTSPLFSAPHVNHIQALNSPGLSDASATPDSSPAAPAARKSFPALTQSARPSIPGLPQPPLYGSAMSGAVSPLGLPLPMTLGQALLSRPTAQPVPTLPTPSNGDEGAEALSVERGAVPAPVFVPRASLGGEAFGPAPQLQQQERGRPHPNRPPRMAAGANGSDHEGSSSQPETPAGESWWDMVESEASASPPRSPAWKLPPPANAKAAAPHRPGLDKSFPALSETVPSAPMSNAGKPGAAVQRTTRPSPDETRLRAARSPRRAGLSVTWCWAQPGPEPCCVL